MYGLVELNFISLSDILIDIASTIEPTPNIVESTNPNRIGAISVETAKAFWNIETPKLQWAQQMSYAAYVLNKALHDADEIAPKIMKYDVIKNFPVRSDSAKQDCIVLLTHASKWGNRESINICNHFRESIPYGDEALLKPILKGDDDGLTEQSKMLELMHIGFIRSELITFLNNNDINHTLESQTEALADEEREIGFNYGQTKTAIKRNAGDADFKLWLSLPTWTPEQAVCLIYEINPLEYCNIKDNHQVEVLRIYAAIKGNMTPYQWQQFGIEQKTPLPKPIINIQPPLEEKQAKTTYKEDIVDYLLSTDISRLVEENNGTSQFNFWIRLLEEDKRKIRVEKINKKIVELSSYDKSNERKPPINSLSDLSGGYSDDCWPEKQQDIDFVLKKDEWQNDPDLTKLEKQHKAILEVIGLKQFDPMAIPDGEKTDSIKPTCEKSYPLIFDKDSSFDNAWKKGRALFKMANHASFAKVGKQ